MKEYICGRDCTLTILQDNTYTAVPFSSETLRVVPLRFTDNDTLLKTQQKVHTYGYEISGCFVSLLTYEETIPLLKLIAERKTFDILIKRGSSKLIYKNVKVKAFELRGRIDDSVYLKIDVQSTNESYIDTWNIQTFDIPWIQKIVMRLRHENWHSDNVDLSGVYAFSFTGDYSGNYFYTLTLHSPLFSHKPIINDSLEPISHACLEIEKILAIDFNELIPMNTMFDTRVADELLVVPSFIVKNAIIFTFQTERDFYQVAL